MRGERISLGPGYQENHTLPRVNRGREGFLGSGMTL